MAIALKVPDICRVSLYAACRQRCLVGKKQVTGEFEGILIQDFQGLPGKTSFTGVNQRTCPVGCRNNTINEPDLMFMQEVR